MRTKPYTDVGVRRLKCSRSSCQNKGFFQWQACADGRVYRPVCVSCDIAVNELVLAFFEDPSATAKMAAYRERVL